ncbi:hypothetical protein STEG23_034590, partial [Scotinomys teguina]
LTKNSMFWAKQQVDCLSLSIKQLPSSLGSSQAPLSLVLLSVDHQLSRPAWEDVYIYLSSGESGFCSPGPGLLSRAVYNQGEDRRGRGSRREVEADTEKEEEVEGEEEAEEEAEVETEEKQNQKRKRQKK